MNDAEENPLSNEEIDVDLDRLRLEAAQIAPDPDQARFIEAVCDAARATTFRNAKLCAHALAICALAGPDHVSRLLLHIYPLMHQLAEESHAAVAASRRGEEGA